MVDKVAMLAYEWVSLLGAGIFGGGTAMRFNNNSLSEVHDHMALYIHMPHGFPRTRFFILMVNG